MSIPTFYNIDAKLMRKTSIRRKNSSLRCGKSDRYRLQHGHPASTFGTGRASGFYLRYRTGIRHLFSGNSGTSRGTRKNVNIYSLICVINMRLLRCGCWNCILLVNKDDARSKNINIQKRVDSDRDKLYNRRNSC